MTPTHLTHESDDNVFICGLILHVSVDIFSVFVLASCVYEGQPVKALWHKTSESGSVFKLDACFQATARTQSSLVCFT